MGPFPNNQNPEVKLLTLKVPLTATPFAHFYLWDNGHKTSIQDLLEMGQEGCILLGFGQIKES